MKTNYVLIDFENVQPKNLEILKGHDFKVMVFVGAKQQKISFDLAAAMQAFGDSAAYVKIDGNGSNALDFHIAFYIGQLSAKDDDCYFHIISKDAGFDPLIRHLKTKKIYAQRVKDVAEIPLLKIANATSQPERLDAIIEFLKSRGTMRPRTVATLSNSINSFFMKKLENDEVTGLLEALVKRKVVIRNGNKVSYQLPMEA